jgi:hypothetical protein
VRQKCAMSVLRNLNAPYNMALRCSFDTPFNADSQPLIDFSAVLQNLIAVTEKKNLFNRLSF